jgi:type I restriction-modification system DNA methylase subunit
MSESHQVPDAIITLVKSFENYLPAYKRGQYSEMQLRQEFIDPFFKALGWDLDNTKRYSELYKEVIHEDPIRIRGSTEFIDYSFRIGGVRKFIVEAKKPAVNIRDDAGPALQIRRYAWNAHLALSILTDFEEFAVYDCTKKPMPGDTAATARIAIFNYKEYTEKWDWIASIFSQDSILQGSFDRFAESTKGKKGTATVDEAILADIEEWRDALAKNMALRNPALTVDELNTAVQRTIDRILFLRICEDRGIEQYGCLQKLLDGPDVYPRLLGLFHRADTRYNSGIFHFTAEAGWDELPDSLTPCLIVDDAVLKKIIKRLYYPESPYEFSVISPVILGQVYEQFLGKVIRLTSGHQARIEYKPEVKKAGGVYYTPQYIVDYIVRQTVGELLKDKTPRDAAKLRILDPACGSGSFLIGAYQYLLDWHLEYYIHKLVPVLADKSVTSPEVLALLPEPLPKSGKKKSAGDVNLPIYRSANARNSRTRSDWKLTTAERKRILLNNIYGVDIDTQAVEVTKLSLLLKVLEEENEENVSKQLKLFDERALPSLHQNIKCGNSLIGTDIYADVQVTLNDPEVVKRINAFDWDREFPEIMQRGGFDAVIGNPPYVRIQTLKEWAPEEVKYYKKKYSVASKGNYDIYLVFVERGLNLIKSSGLFGYILPHKFFTAAYGEPLRKLISDGKYLRQIVHFGHQQVFKGATTYTCLLFLQKKRNASFLLIQVKNIDLWRTSNIAIKGEITSEQYGLKDWNFVIGPEQSVFKKLQKMEPILKTLSHTFVGTQTSAEDVFVLEQCKIDGQYIHGWSKIENRELKIELDAIKWFVKGRHIRRYEPLLTDYALICPYEINDNDFRLFSESEMKSKFPLTFEYLSRHKKYLSEREKGKFLGKEWWAFGYPKSMILFQKSKIVCPFYHIISAYTYDNRGYFFKTGYGILINDSNYSYPYILGLLNSRLLFWYYQKICTVMREGYSHYMTQYIEQIPICTINFSDPADKARHDKVVILVELMLTLHKQRAEVKTDHDKNLIERQIEATDKQIDALVYVLYGLTDDEIRMIEGNSKTIVESNRTSNDDS